MENPYYSSEDFRKSGHEIVDLLSDYFKDTTAGKGVPIRFRTPSDRAKLWKEVHAASLVDLAKLYIEETIHMHHPHFMGHQNGVPLLQAALFELVQGSLNSSAAIYEMGPSGVVIEREVAGWMASKFGWANNEGVFTSGGSMGNLTALLAARQIKSPGNVWRDGYAEKLPTFLMSNQSHYSVDRAVRIMGLGEDGITPVETDDRFRILPESLPKALALARERGRNPIGMIASSCSTATGVYDPLPEIADFCEREGLWLHVDGAHGASASLSPKYKHLLDGAGRADSLVWDAHKLLLMPSLTTAVLFKNGRNAYHAFEQSASYLFQKPKEEEWYNPCHRTIECTKRDLATKLYFSLKLLGEDFFANYVTSVFDLGRTFARILQDSGDFEVVEPESNIVCFRHLPKDGRDLDSHQNFIRQKLLERANFYIVQTRLKRGVFLRTTLTNPLIKEQDLVDLLTEIRTIAKSGA